MELTAKKLTSVLTESQVPVLVEFWASWCPPCKQIEPVLFKLAAEYDGKCKVHKINVDRNPSVTNQFGVKGLPSFAVFVGGNELNRFVGAQSEEDLRTMIESVIAESGGESSVDG